MAFGASQRRLRALARRTRSVGDRSPPSVAEAPRRSRSGSAPLAAQTSSQVAQESSSSRSLARGPGVGRVAWRRQSALAQEGGGSAGRRRAAAVRAHEARAAGARRVAAFRIRALGWSGAATMLGHGWQAQVSLNASARGWLPDRRALRCQPRGVTPQIYLYVWPLVRLGAPCRFGTVFVCFLTMYLPISAAFPV